MHFSLSDNLCLASRAIPVKIGPLPYVLCCDSQFDAFETTKNSLYCNLKSFIQTAAKNSKFLCAVWEGSTGKYLA